MRFRTYEEYKRVPWTRIARALGYNELVIALLQKSRSREDKFKIMENARYGMYDL